MQQFTKLIFGDWANSE